jgi:hypothetical protein
MPQAKITNMVFINNYPQFIIFVGISFGLALAKQLVNLLKGEITIESEVDNGTRVCFTVKNFTLPPDDCLLTSDSIHLQTLPLIKTPNFPLEVNYSIFYPFSCSDSKQQERC